MTYGVATSGVSDAMLDMQRRVAAPLASPGAGSGGQNVDLALFLADENSKGRADPAYAAHMDVIGQWAAAVWNQLAPLISMGKMVRAAIGPMQLIEIDIICLQAL